VAYPLVGPFTGARMALRLAARVDRGPYPFLRRLAGIRTSLSLLPIGKPVGSATGGGTWQS
jgi:hypothetical protein